MTEDSNVNPTLKTLAQQCFDRCDAQKLSPGKTRDGLVIEFFCGVAATLVELKHEDAQCVLLTLQYAICPRGFSEVERLAHRGKCYACERLHPQKCQFCARLEQEQRALIPKIREHALANYNHKNLAWDYIVESYDDEDILRGIGSARTLRDAMRELRPTLRALRSRDDEQRALAKSEHEASL